MYWPRNMPIKRKLTLIILLTCTAALVVAGIAMIAAEIVRARQGMVEDMAMLANLLGHNSSAALSFHRDEDVEEVNKILSALQADPHILAACVYDKQHKPFGEYVRSGAISGFPDQPPPVE